MRAKEAQEFATAFEELQIIMSEFNMTGEAGSSALKDYMNKQITKGKITSYKTKRNAETNTIQCIIEKDGYMFYAVPDGEYWKVVTTETGSADVGGIEVQVYTEDNVTEDGVFELGNATKETEVVFYDKVEGELNFEIKEGVVSIYIYDDMKLTNSGMKRSAIDIYPGAKLNLYLEEGATMTVDSGYGTEVPIASTEQSIGGKGGYAGVHVPWDDKNNNGEREEGEYATFNIYGDGTLIAYGGDAADGAGTISGQIGGGRWRSEQELELVEIGGVGGDSNSTNIRYTSETNHGFDGQNGESCGLVTINDDIKIFAYGGSGGCGGVRISGSASGGGGGYPRHWSWSVVGAGGGRR